MSNDTVEKQRRKKAPLCKHLTHIVTRGVCRACYMAMRRRVREGLTSWSELESLGAIHPSNRGLPSSEYIKKVDAAIAESGKS